MRPPLLTPPDFFETQRSDVLAAIQKPTRINRWIALAACLLVTAGYFMAKDDPCLTYACLLESTPSHELPVEWALQGLSEDEFFIDDWSDLQFNDTWPNPPKNSIK
jgi:hypothetical protein